MLSFTCDLLAVQSDKQWLRKGNSYWRSRFQFDAPQFPLTLSLTHWHSWHSKYAGQPLGSQTVLHQDVCVRSWNVTTGKCNNCPTLKKTLHQMNALKQQTVCPRRNHGVTSVLPMKIHTSSVKPVHNLENSIPQRSGHWSIHHLGIP